MQNRSLSLFACSVILLLAACTTQSPKGEDILDADHINFARSEPVILTPQPVLPAPETEKAEIKKVPREKHVAPPVKKPMIAKPAAKSMPAMKKPAEKKPPVCRDGQLVQSAAGSPVRIMVKGEKTLSKDYPLNEKGEVDFPFIGKTKVAGLTASTLQKELTEKLGAGYLVKPEVHVEFIGCE